MSQMTGAEVQTRQADPERRERARVRAASVKQRLSLATDALAAADLLLGLNFSIRSVGQEPPK